ncbi:MAG: glycosyltransferase family 2 protein [Kiritimatiellia bacterium]
MQRTDEGAPLLVSVVVPLYNEKQNVAPLVEELNAVRPQVPGLEAILVDDGSTDGTWEQIRQTAQQFPWVRGIRTIVNRGQSAALLLGFAEARGGVIVTMDGDLQNNPADLPLLLERLAGCDVVCGYRVRRRDTWSRRLASRLANAIRSRLTGDGIRDIGCTLKAFRVECVKDLPPLDGVHRFMPCYFRLNGRQIVEVPVDHRPRRHGASKYTNLKRLPRTLRDLVGFLWYRRRFLKPLDLDSVTRT